VRALLVALAILVAGCPDNLMVGNVKPVPPVHRVPIESEGAVVLVGEDAVIETNDPVHISRAKDARIPQDLRASMVTALGLAGFKVVTSAAQPHELVAKVALAVREESGKVHQTYRCGLRSPEGAEIAQFDWAWPQGTFVEETDVLDYATHNVATEIATSRRLAAYLQSSRASRSSPSPSATPPDAGGEAGL
jgi:hypothetical protein